MSFLTALSGLNAAQTDIAATSNNIANVGTLGYHRSRAEFADIFANQPYSRPDAQVGSGVETAQMTRDFSQGTTQATGNVLDLSLRGPGFFQVRTGGEGSEYAYTRAGAFQMNKDGSVVNSAGAMLMGFPVAGDGSALSVNQTAPISIPQSKGDPKATENIALSVSMPLGANNGMGSQGAIPAADFDPTDSATYAFATDLPAYDASGNAVDARAYFAMSKAPDATDGSVSYNVYLTVNGEVSGGATPDMGTMTFDEDGALVGGGSGMGFTFGDGTVNLNVGGSSVTSGANFAVNSANHDGERSLGLSMLEVTDDGVISATYGGEIAVAVGRVAVANFVDVQALAPKGGATYLETRESGQPRLSTPGEAGYGDLQSGVIEQSNVELTEELVHLITAQRNYQASAKALETSSSLAQTIIQMRG